MTDLSRDVQDGWIKLTLRTAADARRWIKQHYPKGAQYRGYNSNGDCILISLVREQGNKAPVATASRNRAASSVQFTVKPVE